MDWCLPVLIWDRSVTEPDTTSTAPSGDELMKFLLAIAVLILAVPAHADPGESLLVVRHRWHTGLVIPADKLDPDLRFLRDHLPDTGYYEFGWGDADFYQHNNSIPRLLKALFWPTDSVLHVVALERHPAQLPHKDLAALCPEPDHWHRLTRALAADFQRNADGTVRTVGPGLYGASLFFQAEGTFWLGRTCNRWSSQRLRQAGAPIRGTLTAGGLMRQLKALPATCNAGHLNGRRLPENN